jgi:hypothetical protein
VQEIKDTIAACRDSGFQDSAAASVAGGLTKAMATACRKDELPKPKKLKAFDAFSDTDSSGSDDDDARTCEA